LLKLLRCLVNCFLAGLLLLILLAPATPVLAAQPVDRTLVTERLKSYVDSSFDVAIQASAGPQPVRGMDVYLDFDPAKLEVIDQDDSQEGVQISPAGAFGVILQNSVDNAAGRIAFSAGSQENLPSWDFAVTAIRFKAKAATETTTAVTFSTSPERTTLVLAEDQSFVTGQLNGLELSLE